MIVITIPKSVIITKAIIVVIITVIVLTIAIVVAIRSNYIYYFLCFSFCQKMFVYIVFGIKASSCFHRI